MQILKFVLFCDLYVGKNVYIISKEIQRLNSIYNTTPKFYFLFSTVHTTTPF